MLEGASVLKHSNRVTISFSKIVSVVSQLLQNGENGVNGVTARLRVEQERDQAQENAVVEVVGEMISK